MYRGQRVMVVIPAFNEEDSIQVTVESVPHFVDKILVIDDASSDGTREIALKSGSEVMTHKQNKGVGAAIVSGYRQGIERGYDAVAVMAGDGQMDPDDLPHLLDPIIDGEADYVKGNRFASEDVRQVMPKMRWLGNIVLSNLTKITSGYRHVFDSQCGYTAITAHALSGVKLDEVFPRYGYPNDLLARLNAAGMRVVDVPVRAIYGDNWKSGVKWHTAIHPISFVLMRSWWNRSRAKRSSEKHVPH